jgi:CelD/BcsL family acetyltransferase involved in cellulose biosynthesis
VETIRPHPRHGWLAAVIPAGARTFRVQGPELAVAITDAGGQIVDERPDVEIGTPAWLAGDATCAIVEIGAREPVDRRRIVRGARRLVAAAELRRGTAAARRGFAARGYESVEVLNWERGITLGSAAGNGRQFAHRFPLNAVVVAQHERHRTILEEVVAAAESAIGSRLEVDGYVLGASGVIIARTERAVLRVAVGPAARRIEEQVETLRLLARANPQPTIAERVPWTLASGRSGLAVWSVEQALPGARAQPTLTPSLERDCIDFLVELHALDGGTGPRLHVEEHAEIVAGLCDAAGADEVRELAEGFAAETRELSRGFGHGDFWNGNVLTENGTLTGVVDWPGGGPGRLPLLDLLHLKVSAVRELTGQDLGEAIVSELLPAARLAVDDLIRAYLDRLGLDAGDRRLEALVGAYWLQAVAHEVVDPDRDPVHAGDRTWRKVNVDSVRDALRHRPPALASRGRPAVSGCGGAVEVIRDPSALRPIEGEWRSLAEARGAPFITPDWYRAWLRSFGDESTPFVVSLRDDGGSLVGLMPLVLSQRRHFPTLSFGGADYGDYYQPVARSEADEETVARTFAQVLGNRKDEWAMIVADYVDEDAPWTQALTRSNAVSLKPIRYHEHPSVYLSIPLRDQTWDEYLAGRSRNLRGQLGRKRRALERLGTVRFRRAGDDLEGAMNTLFDLHARRWAGKGSTIFSSRSAREFHMEFARDAREHDWLRLWFLDVDEKPIAAWYGWSIGGRYLYYQAGFDPAWSRVSPGLLLLAHTIEAAFDEGASEYDMLLGNEPFKERFATAATERRTLVLVRPAHAARALVLADVGLRRIGHRLPAPVHDRVRGVVAPLLRRWPVETAP